MRRGTIYTETVVYAAPERFTADAPYQLVIVNLDGGGRITARILGDTVAIDDRRRRIGTPSTASFFKNCMKHAVADRDDRVSASKPPLKFWCAPARWKPRAASIIHLEIGEPDFDTPGAHRRGRQAGARRGLDPLRPHPGPARTARSHRRTMSPHPRHSRSAPNTLSSCPAASPSSSSR